MRQQPEKILVNFGWNAKPQTRLPSLFLTTSCESEGLSDEVGATTLAVNTHNRQQIEDKLLTMTYLAVLKGANGSCRAVSEFDMKNWDVTAAAQFTAGQSVTLTLP